MPVLTNWRPWFVSSRNSMQRFEGPLFFDAGRPGSCPHETVCNDLKKSFTHACPYELDALVRVLTKQHATI